MMRYKNMARNLTKEEAQILLWTLVPEGILTGMKRYLGVNSVEVSFYLDTDKEQKTYHMRFLLEEPVDIPEDVFIKDTYCYTQFTMVKGYHTAWLGNVFVEHKIFTLSFPWVLRNKGRRFCQSGE